MSKKRIASSRIADVNQDESETEVPPESTIPSDCERTAEEIAEGFRRIVEEDADEEWWAPAKGLAREDITADLDARDQEIEEAEEAAQQERASGDLRRELQRADEEAAKKRHGKNIKPTRTKSKRLTSDKPKKMRWKSYGEGISAAITELNDPAGSSSSAIKKSMQANMPARKKWLNSTFQSTLKKMTADGVLVQAKAAYKLRADEARREADAEEARRREAAAAEEAVRQVAAAAEAARREAKAEEARRREVAAAEEARREAATAAEAARLQQPAEDHQDQQVEDPIVQPEPSPSTPAKVHPPTDTTAKSPKMPTKCNSQEATTPELCCGAIQQAKASVQIGKGSNNKGCWGTKGADGGNNIDDWNGIQRQGGEKSKTKTKLHENDWTEEDTKTNNKRSKTENKNATCKAKPNAMAGRPPPERDRMVAENKGCRASANADSRKGVLEPKYSIPSNVAGLDTSKLALVRQAGARNQKENLLPTSLKCDTRK